MIKTIMLGDDAATYIAGWGTIYSTGMYCAMVADKTTIDAVSPDSDVGIVGHNDLKGVTFQHESIQ